MDQCLFDELMLLIFETISSQDYLDSISIHRPSSINWETFKKQVAKQKVKPGIYPRSFGRGVGVHYYAVRAKDGKMIVASGYPSKGGILAKYSIGLNAQRDHSHGLCQTFALMYYMDEEKQIKSGKYYQNVKNRIKFFGGFC